MKHKKVIVLSGILVLAALLAYVAATHFGSGQCGENATWRVVGHTMTISGTGPMKDYDYPQDYLEYIDQIEKVMNRVKTIVIEDGITTIGKRSFEPFQYLSSVEIPDSVTSIGESAFHGCKNLTNVTIPNSVAVIGNLAFASSGLTSVTIPGNVAIIGWMPFGYCDNLTGIWVAAENQNFCNDEKGAMYDKAMTTLLQCPVGFEGTFEVPDSVTSIGRDAFSGCNRLTNMTIPDNVTAIGGYAFSDCANLTSVTIPGSVTSIGMHPFADCTSLSEITFEGDAPVFEVDCFPDVKATVHYPADNPTWTGIVQQTYGGDITWVAY